MHKLILTMADVRVSDLIESMLDQARPGEYKVLKAGSLAEANGWFEITTPSMIYVVIAGLGEQQNAACIHALERSFVRVEYNIVIMDLLSNAVRQIVALGADGILAQPFKQETFLRILDLFETTPHRALLIPTVPPHCLSW